MPLENGMNYLHMELKVCEGCGALWLRAGTSVVVYCRGCAAELSQFPPARGRRSPSRARNRHRAEALTGRGTQAGMDAGGAR